MEMRKSFYSWLMTQRNPKSDEPVAILADYSFETPDFPKHSSDFDEISRFLEEESRFDFSMRDFDQIWELYLAH